jgi:hypothetical protein
MNSDTRTCLTCGKPLKGRIDKKFCDDYCRSNYNNSLNSDSSAFVRRVNNILRKNRRILMDLIPEGEETSKHPKEKLLRLGYNFQYFTHIYTTKKGVTYHFCYEAGYLLLEGDWVLLVKRKEE